MLSLQLTLVRKLKTSKVKLMKLHYIIYCSDLQWAELCPTLRLHRYKTIFKQRSSSIISQMWLQSLPLPTFFLRLYPLQYNRVRDESDEAYDRDYLVLDEVLMLKPPKATLKNQSSLSLFRDPFLAHNYSLGSLILHISQFPRGCLVSWN